MPDDPAAPLTVARLLAQPLTQAHDLVVLDYDARLIRRKRLETVSGLGFLVDLPQVTNLDDYWGFELSDGTTVEVVAAEEDLVAVTGPNLPRLAWHVGNRHTPCQIEPARLLIRRDHVIEAMLAHQGATLTPVSEPFTPEGGAYGHGRTMGHSHDAGHGHEGTRSPPTADHTHPDGADFGWHHHGDGVLHRHGPAPKPAPAPLPFGTRKPK
jgi:urease accessory protein